MVDNQNVGYNDRIVRICGINIGKLDVDWSHKTKMPGIIIKIRLE